VVVDGPSRRLRDGTPLDPAPHPFDHNGVFGWIDRRDLASACRLALDAPLAGAPVYHLVASSLGRRLFDVGAAERELGWHPVHDFAADVPDGVVPLTLSGGHS
jgi:nucleoside-diphosphate-sugar epimerase